jgi:hypothetical protein
VNRPCLRSSRFSETSFIGRRLVLKGDQMKTLLASIVVAMTAATCLAGPTITVSVTPTTISNVGEDAIFTLTLSSPASRKIAVNFVLTGTAQQGSDYLLTGNFNQSGQIVIPSGQSSAMVTLHSYDDDSPIKSETAIFNLLGGDRYHVGRPNHATLTIENDRP